MKGEFEKRVNQLVFGNLNNVEKLDIRKGLESNVISALAKRAHLTGVTIDKADILVEDILYEIFENSSVNWMAKAYVGLHERFQEMIDEARKEFPVFPRPKSPAIATIDAITFKTLATVWFEKWFGNNK